MKIKHFFVQKPATLIVKSLLLFALAAFFSLALVSFDLQDQSANMASSKVSVAENLMGSAGAFIADPLLQFCGFANIFPIIACFIWSFMLFRDGQISFFYLKLVSFILAILLISFLLSMLPELGEFSSFMENGGFVGEYLKSRFNENLNEFGLQGQKLLFIIASVVCCILLVSFTCSFKFFKLFTSLKQLFEPKEKREQQVKIKQKRKNVKNVTSVNHSQDETAIHDFVLPATSLFNEVKNSGNGSEISKGLLEENAKKLQNVLKDFGINGEITKVHPGPVVTLYEIEPSAGTKASRVIALADDIARSMSAISARIAVLPGKNALGAELPNEKRKIIYLRSILESEEYKNHSHKLPIILGRNISDEDVIVDLAKMPHLLVAGTTGSGKSVAINTMILSLLYSLSPKQCKFIMIDPKMLELSVYEGIPHLLAPVVTEPGKAITALKWVVKEMENRYRLMSNLGVRNIEGYNKAINAATESGEVLEKTVQTGFNAETGKPIFEKLPLEMEELPFIVVIVDEMADLMIVAGKDIESSIQRLAQMARAAGIHIIMATQRPSVDVITGVIKANFPTRISFQVTSKIDSRTIIGEQGAEQLLGMGDMLYMGSGSRLTRVHGPFVEDGEVERVVSFLKAQSVPTYKPEITEESSDDEEGSYSAPAGEFDKEASLYDQAVAIIMRDKKVSTSYIQRSLKIGYNRAADIIDKMEQEGLISQPNHVGKREILVGGDD